METRQTIHNKAVEATFIYEIKNMDLVEVLLQRSAHVSNKRNPRHYQMFTEIDHIKILMHIKKLIENSDEEE